MMNAFGESNSSGRKRGTRGEFIFILIDMTYLD
jgi:hypothetical protein